MTNTERIHRYLEVHPRAPATEIARVLGIGITYVVRAMQNIRNVPIWHPPEQPSKSQPAPVSASPELTYEAIQEQRKLHQDVRLVARYFGVDALRILRVEREYERAQYLAQYHSGKNAK